jgi:hypothetical protein
VFNCKSEEKNEMGSGKECKIKEGFFSSILYDSAAGVYADGTNPLERESMI